MPVLSAYNTTLIFTKLKDPEKTFLITKRSTTHSTLTHLVLRWTTAG